MRPITVFLFLLLAAFSLGAKITLPPIIVGDYVITKADSVVENQAVVFADGARLVFEGNRSQFRYCSVAGKGKVVFWNLKDGIARDNVFENSGGVQLHCLRTPGFKAVGNRFLGQNNSEELFVVEPGHQWQFPDASKYGFKFNPSTKYDRGQNRLQLINTFRNDRQIVYSGGKSVRFNYGTCVPTYNEGSAKLNSWIVWGTDSVIHKVQLLSADSQGVTLTAGGLPIGAARMATWNPEAFVSGVQVANNVFAGPGEKSGFSGYGLSGAIVEDNFAAGFDDYGLGLEVGSGNVLRRNVCVANQPGQLGQAKYWNQMEIVSPLGVHYLGNNSGIVGEVIWFYAPGQIQSDRATRPPKAEWVELAKAG